MGLRGLECSSLALNVPEAVVDLPGPGGGGRVTSRRQAKEKHMDAIVPGGPAGFSVLWGM